MRLVAHVWGAEPWYIDDPEHLSCDDLDQAIYEACEQTAADAGSDLLEAPTEECRTAFSDHMRREMTTDLREPGDSYRAPDGVLYTLED